MAEYLITLVSVSVICGIVGILSPKGDTGKYISFLCGICVLGVMITPVAEIIKNFDELSGALEEPFVENSKEYYQNIFNENLKNGGIEQAESLLKEKISKELDIGEEKFDIQLIVESGTDELKIKRVVVRILPGGITIDTEEVIEYVEEQLNCPCVIIYD